MLLVVDFNVVFSSLIRKGIPYKVFLLNSISKKFRFIVPEYVWEEFELDKERLLKESKYSKEEFEEILLFLKGEIEIVPEVEFLEFFPKAKELLGEEKKDAPYLALALAYNCKIFSGDKRLRSKIPEFVVTPRELLDMLLGKRRE